MCCQNIFELFGSDCRHCHVFTLGTGCWRANKIPLPTPLIIIIWIMTSHWKALVFLQWIIKEFNRSINAHKNENFHSEDRKRCSKVFKLHGEKAFNTQTERTVVS